MPLNQGPLCSLPIDELATMIESSISLQRRVDTQFREPFIKRRYFKNDGIAIETQICKT
jgi:predicted Ser/Thr protein kinase